MPLHDITGGSSLDGWVDAAETWTYASADDPTYTLTVSGDKTSKYSAGMRGRVSQATGGTKYFVITNVAYGAPNTTLTLYGGTDYDLSNEAILAPAFSTHKAPQGFPLDPAKWTVETTDTSQRSQANPTSGTWYNLGSITISIPIGCWHVMYEVVAGYTRTTTTAVEVNVALSDANNSASDQLLRSYQYEQSTTASSVHWSETTHHRERTLTLAAKTSYYLNAMEAVVTGAGTLYFEGTYATTVIRARCAYL